MFKKIILTLVLIFSLGFFGGNVFSEYDESKDYSNNCIFYNCASDEDKKNKQETEKQNKIFDSNPENDGYFDQEDKNEYLKGEKEAIERGGRVDELINESKEKIKQEKDKKIREDTEYENSLNDYLKDERIEELESKDINSLTENEKTELYDIKSDKANSNYTDHINSDEYKNALKEQENHFKSKKDLKNVNEEIKNLDKDISDVRNTLGNEGLSEQEKKDLNTRLDNLKYESEKLKNKSNLLKNKIDSYEEDPSIQEAKDLKNKVGEAKKAVENHRVKICDTGSLAGTCIDQPTFMIGVKDITPGGDNLEGDDREQVINNFFGNLIQTLMIGLGSLALLIMTIGAGYMILAHGQDELLSKGKSIFMSGIISLVVALTSYYLVAFVRFLLYS